MKLARRTASLAFAAPPLLLLASVAAAQPTPSAPPGLASETPARSALARLMRIAPGSRSLPWNRVAVVSAAAGPARASSACQAAGSNVARLSKAKRRARPGASPAEISAASMTKVPEPHIGSRTGSRPSKPHWRRNIAASVSRIGALATAALNPRL